jgi:ornithine cyclodeaminase/alanine dehydrogenase-like protein (mu-crystallin family)
MAAIFLSEDDVQRLLDYPAVVAAVAESFRQLAAGRAENIPRARCRTATTILHSMSAAADYLGLVGWKQYTTSRQGARFLVGLYDATSGELVALVDANRLGQMRTGATTAVAVRYLTAPNVDRLGLFGAGWQAESQLAAVCTVRSIRRAIVYSRTRAKAQAFAERMTQRLSIEVVAASAPNEAVEGMPLLITATTSRRPVFDGSLVADGALVAAIGSNWPQRAEIDAMLVGRAAAIVCDSIDACRREAGDLLQAERAGEFEWQRATELSAVVAGRTTLSAERGGVTIFKSVGLALADVATGELVLRRAREAGAGQALPT